MSDSNRLFGPTIRSARLERPEPMTQEALARELGVSQPTISGWESGEVFPTFGNIVRLCRLLDLDVTSLVEKIAKETEGVPA